MVGAALSTGARAFASWLGEGPGVEVDVDSLGVRAVGVDREVSIRVDADDWRTAASEWAARDSALRSTTGAAAPVAGLKLLVAASTAFGLGVGARASHRDGGPIALRLWPSALVRLAWTPIGAQGGAGRTWSERGFRRCCDGTRVSLALADGNDRRMAAAALGIPALSDRPLPGSATAIAAELQAWGLMCLPARELAVHGLRASAGLPAVLPRRSLLCRDGEPADRDRQPTPAPSLVVLGKPLADLAVVTLGSLVAGPFAGVLLAAAGAAVRHVIHPARPPLDFGVVPVMVEALDAATPGGRRRLIGLLREASGLVENFRPRVLGNLDLHPLPLRPSPTHVALPGFPACSPRANWRSVGFQLEACQGLGVQPLADAPAVVAVGATPLVSDLASALLAAGSVVTLPPGSTVELAQAKTLRRAGVLRW